MLQPTLVTGNAHQDERGTLSFVNDFDMLPVKRFYTIFHPNTAVIRAWQGHQQEQKWFFVLDGSFKILLVQPDNWQHPSAQLPVRSFELSDATKQVLHVPGGFASGFRALVPNSRMIVYSDMNLEHSKQDDFRFDKTLWYKWD